MLCFLLQALADGSRMRASTSSQMLSAGGGCDRLHCLQCPPLGLQGSPSAGRRRPVLHFPPPPPYPPIGRDPFLRGPPTAPARSHPPPPPPTGQDYSYAYNEFVEQRAAAAAAAAGPARWVSIWCSIFALLTAYIGKVLFNRRGELNGGFLQTVNLLLCAGENAREGHVSSAFCSRFPRVFEFSFEQVLIQASSRTNSSYFLLNVMKYSDSLRQIY